MIREWPRTGRLQSGWLKPEHHWNPSTEHRWHRRSDMSARSPKDTKRQQPPQPQSAHPAAIWQKIQKYHLLYHKTAERLNSRGCEIPELILYTPLSTIDTAGLMDSIILVSSYATTTLSTSLHESQLIYNHMEHMPSTDLYKIVYVVSKTCKI